MTPECPKVAVIDDDESVRRALARFIKSAGLEVATFCSAREFLDNPARDSVDCVVVDLRMPEMGGIDLQEELNRNGCHPPLVFITGQGDVATTVRAMKAGAVDFLEKPVDNQALLAAIARAADLNRQSRAASAEIDDLRRRYLRLTRREREVFALVTTGLLNKQIGARLGAAEKTIKVHRARVMEKMEAASLPDLVRTAERLAIHATDGVVP